MLIVNKFKIDEFLLNNPDSIQYLAALFKIIGSRNWKEFDEMRKDFPFSLEGQEKKAFFIIGSGRYIVRARINFKYQQVIIRNISAKADYDQNRST